MATMNVFDDQVFSLTSLSGYVEKMPYTPQLLGELGIFEPMPVRTRNVFVDRSDDSLALIPASADGAPPDVLDKRDRDAISLRTTRLTKRFQLYAYEIEGVRASGTETELQAMQSEFDQRMRRLRADMELTHEHHRLGALQGALDPHARFRRRFRHQLYALHRPRRLGRLVVCWRGGEASWSAPSPASSLPVPSSGSAPSASVTGTCDRAAVFDSRIGRDCIAAFERMKQSSGSLYRSRPFSFQRRTLRPSVGRISVTACSAVSPLK